MVIKGTSCAGARRLAVHLTRTDTNETVTVKELRGVAAEDLRGALLEMEAVSEGARTVKPFYHASINTGVVERLTDKQRTEAIDRLEAALGLSGQARVVLVHEKKGREHCHIVWSRIDLEHMRAISDSHNYRKHEEVARSLEREFGHERVQGAHIERDGKERPRRTPSHAEMLQAERTGMSPKQVKDKVTELWRSTDNGPAFAAALSDAGFVLARGDRRDFVVIDPKGGTHSLSRRVEGATAKDIRERLADIDPRLIPNVVDAKNIQRTRQQRNGPRADQGLETEPGARRVVPDEIPKVAPNADPGRSRGTPEGAAAPRRAADGIGRAASAMLDGLASIFERGLSGSDSQVDQTKRLSEAEPEPGETQHEASVRNEQEERDQRRQALLRSFGRELERDVDDDRDLGRERERPR